MSERQTDCVCDRGNKRRRDTLCVCVCVWMRFCCVWERGRMCEFVCVCSRERQSECDYETVKECLCVWEKERNRERIFVYLCKRDREKEKEKEKDKVKEKEREKEKYLCVCEREGDIEYVCVCEWVSEDKSSFSLLRIVKRVKRGRSFVLNELTSNDFRTFNFHSKNFPFFGFYKPFSNEPSTQMLL
jgi:hypothetical protein